MVLGLIFAGAVVSGTPAIILSEADSRFPATKDEEQMTDNLLASFFPRPSDDDRLRRRAELLLRAASVRGWGWDDYRYQWSTGEVVAVAALLGDGDVLSDMGETLQAAYRRWAYDLWGMADAQADEAVELRATRKWFSEAATDIERTVNDPEFEQSLRAITGW